MIPVLSKPEMGRLRKLLDGGGTPGDTSFKPPKNRPFEGLVYIVKIEDGEPIDGAVDHLPGSKNLPLYEFDEDTLELKPILDDDGEHVREYVHNLSTLQSPTGWQLAVQETPTGRLILAPGGSSSDEGGGGSGGGGGFTTSCECKPMVNLPGDPSVCCEGSLMFEANFFGGVREFKYNPDDQWSTDPEGFDDPDACTVEDDPNVRNKYRITITASADPWGSTMQLELVEDNGCAVKCFLYKAMLPFRCGCENQFARITFDNIAADRLPCWVTIKPKSQAFAVVDPPNWTDLLCGLIPSEEIPIGWTYTHEDFDGARCMPPGQRDYIYKYSGEWAGDGFNPGFTVWGNANAPRGFPLLRTAGFGSWQSPDVHDGAGVLVGAVPHPVYARTTLEITCGGGLTFTLKIRGVSVPVTGPGDGGPIVTYTKSIPLADVEPHEIACLLNADHTLTRTGGGSTDPQNGFCPGEYDPVFEALSIPDSVDISPFGGGPEECPNPDDPTYGDPPTTEGYCGSPCTTPTAEPDPGGSETCCVDSECFDDLTGTDCTDIGGEIVASCDDCDQAWACCHEGSCYHMTRSECVSMVGHEFSYHEGDLCSAVECEGDDPTVGACCGPGGSCTDNVDQEDCSAELFHGGNDCGGVTCPPNVGACCIDGVCSVMSSSACNTADGEYAGDGTDCSGIDCTTGACCRRPTGATCSNDSQCECYDMSEATCEGNGGTWYVGVDCVDIGFQCTCENPICVRDD